MSLIPYNRDIGLFDDLRKELRTAFPQSLFNALADDRLTEERSSIWSPAVDIKEEEEAYIVTADVPGVDPQNIEVTFENGLLRIQGERKSETSEEKKGFKRLERVHGTFLRQFSLPESIDADSIRAAGKNGVLEIVIPKKPAAKPKRITIS